METARACMICGNPLPDDAPGNRCASCSSVAGATPTVVMTDSRPGMGDELVEPLAIAQIELLGVIGEGGMGAVYKARQTHLDRIVAVKAIRLDFLGDSGVEERFEREARALAKLNHPNILTVHDFGRAGKQCYLVMEYVDGANLRQIMESRTLQPDEGIKIIGGICDALEYAHSQGIIHRDMKPENVLIDAHGRVKIADFGLASLGENAAADRRLTTTGQVMGTLHYMAPEQVERPTEVDHRADIYALGVIFYEMLTRELPLGRFALPSELAESDIRLDDVVIRALQKEPQKRYQTATEVRTKLEHIRATPGKGRTRRRIQAVPTATIPAEAGDPDLHLDRNFPDRADADEHAITGPSTQQASVPDEETVRDIARRYRRYGMASATIAFVLMYLGIEFEFGTRALPVVLAFTTGGIISNAIGRRVLKKFERYDDAHFRKYKRSLRARAKTYGRLGIGFLAPGILLYPIAGYWGAFAFLIAALPFCAIGYAFHASERSLSAALSRSKPTPE